MKLKLMIQYNCMEVSEMFKTGDYIHYSTNGLCRVEEVTTLDFDGADRSRLYYRLVPVEGKGSTIFTPVDNPKVSMRLAMTREEAEELKKAVGRISADTVYVYPPGIPQIVSGERISQGVIDRLMKMQEAGEL